MIPEFSLSDSALPDDILSLARLRAVSWDGCGDEDVDDEGGMICGGGVGDRLCRERWGACDSSDGGAWRYINFPVAVARKGRESSRVNRFFFRDAWQGTGERREIDTT